MFKIESNLKLNRKLNAKNDFQARFNGLLKKQMFDSDQEPPVGDPDWTLPCLNRPL